MWAASGIDVFVPEQIELHAVDLEVSQDFAGLPQPLRSEDLAFGILPPASTGPGLCR